MYPRQVNSLVWNIKLAGMISHDIKAIAIFSNVEIEVIIINAVGCLFLKILLQDFRGEGNWLKGARIVGFVLLS